jgi:superfamily II DNA or RNA helicase
MPCYIYIRDNKWFKSENVYKVGITSTSIIDRSSSYITGEIYKGIYVKIYEFDINKEKLRIIDNLLKREFNHLNIYFDGGTEFYDRIIIDNIEDFFNKYNLKFITKNEEDLKRLNRNVDKILNNFLKLSYKLLEKDIEDLRDYQIEAIKHITNELKLNNKCYLQLATGAGKSKIAINVISNIKPLIIIIFSPRVNIKNQNISDKYLEVLDLRKFKYNIYSYCYQSYKKVYSFIKTNKLKEIFIWFDESHWALDNWVTDIENGIKQFFMTDDSYIKYRLFTTASPNKDFIINNKKFYGELYEPIKFKELRDKEFLADIKVEIFDKEIEKEDIEYNNLIFNTFNKPEQERKLGFSFHNTCNSAYLSYLNHLKDFKTGKIDIKPYLLINEEFIKKEKDSFDFNDNNNDNDNYNDNYNDNLKIIKKIKKDIGEIDYHSQISKFEKEVKNNQKALGYVVAKYSIGYDNPDIDIIYFTDPKLSYKDIIQSIGRGTRIKGDKYLRVILPTNSNNEVGSNYKKIENILKYLLIDIELEYDKIKTFKLKPKKELEIGLELGLTLDIDMSNYNSTLFNYFIEEDIDDKSPINTMKHNIIVKANEWTIPKIITQLKYNNIHNIEDYISYSNKNKNINLPDINELILDDNFNFRDTYNNESECPYYYNKKECIEIIKSYEDYFIINNIIDDIDKLRYLNKTDKKIPKMNLCLFYGGNRKDYYLD